MSVKGWHKNIYVLIRADRKCVALMSVGIAHISHLLHTTLHVHTRKKRRRLELTEKRDESNFISISYLFSTIQRRTWDGSDNILIQFKYELLSLLW